MRNLFLILFCVTFTSVYSQESIFKTFYVGDSKIACQYNNTITSCLKVKNHPDSNWVNFPYDINGFIFEQGVECLIEVEEIPVINPVNNSPKYTYKLIRVIQTKKTVLDNKKLLASNRWRIINFELDRVTTPAKRANGYMNFDLDSNKIYGYGGCNSFGGNVLIEDGIIQFGHITNTLLSCPHDAIEAKLMEGLKGKAAFYIRNNMLFIVCENRMSIHLRPEKKLDSMMNEINKPDLVSRGNTFGNMQNGHYVVTLDEVPEAAMKQMIFVDQSMNDVERGTIKVKLTNLSAEDPIKEIHILKKAHKDQGYYYAVVLFKDGTSREIVIRNVL